MRTNSLRNTIRRVINEQPGTPWCSYCHQSHPPNYCAAGGRPCNANFNKDALSCQACKNLFPSNNTSTINANCNQQGQPCYTPGGTWVSPGKGWAKADQNIQARKRPNTYDGTDGRKIKIGESELINIIKRTINESQLLLERPTLCDDDFGCSFEKFGTECCMGGEMNYTSRIGSCTDGKCGAGKCHSGAGTGNCRGKTTKGGTKVSSKAEMQRMVKSAKGNNKAKDEKIAVSESELINIIKRTVNESSLLTEKAECRGWFDCPTCGGGRTTCKKGGKEINTSDGGGTCGCDGGQVTGGDCDIENGETMGARGCVCMNPKRGCGEPNMTIADVKVLQDNPDPIIQKSIRCFFCPGCNGCYRQKNPRDPSLDGRG